jgi:uncharacterized metal-binding protein
MEIALIGNLLYETKYNTSIFESIYNNLCYEKEFEVYDKIYDIVKSIMVDSHYQYEQHDIYIAIQYRSWNRCDNVYITPDKLREDKIKLTQLLTLLDYNEITIQIIINLYGNTYLTNHKLEVYNILCKYCGLTKKMII